MSAVLAGGTEWWTRDRLGDGVLTRTQTHHRVYVRLRRVARAAAVPDAASRSVLASVGPHDGASRKRTAGEASIGALVAAGLIDIDEEGAAPYRVATLDRETWVEAVEAEYSRSPDAVRRTIINGASHGDLAAFANAFKWRTER